MNSQKQNNMWVIFKNNVSINLSNITTIMPSEYGNDLVLVGIAGYAVTLYFNSKEEMHIVYSEITAGLNCEVKVRHLDFEARIYK